MSTSDSPLADDTELILGYISRHQPIPPGIYRFQGLTVVQPEPMEIKLEAQPKMFYPTEDFYAAKPSKFIPSKENQPWKRNRK
jgi:hypothetical protein